MLQEAQYKSIYLIFEFLLNWILKIAERKNRKDTAGCTYSKSVESSMSSYAFLQ